MQGLGLGLGSGSGLATVRWWVSGCRVVAHVITTNTLTPLSLAQIRKSIPQHQKTVTSNNARMSSYRHRGPPPTLVVVVVVVVVVVCVCMYVCMCMYVCVRGGALGLVLGRVKVRFRVRKQGQG